MAKGKRKGKVTDRQKKQIMVDYLDCENYSAVARKHNLSWTTIKNIVSADKNSLKKLEHKKEENTKDVLQYMEDSKKHYIKSANYVFERFNPDNPKSREELDGLPLPKIMTSFGILTDKMLKAKELSLKHQENDNFDEVNKNIMSIADILKAPKERHKIERDDEGAEE